RDFHVTGVQTCALPIYPSGARPRVLLVDNHDSYTWNLHQLIWQVAGVEPVTVRNDEVDPAEVLAAGHTHLVISPGPGTPLRGGEIGRASCRERVQSTAA